MDRFMKETDVALDKCRKNIILALASFFNESQRMKDFDLDNVEKKEIADFMQADISN